MVQVTGSVFATFLWERAKRGGHCGDRACNGCNTLSISGTELQELQKQQELQELYGITQKHASLS
jgi:hypothetical protein